MIYKWSQTIFYVAELSMPHKLKWMPITANGSKYTSIFQWILDLNISLSLECWYVYVYFNISVNFGFEYILVVGMSICRKDSFRIVLYDPDSPTARFLEWLVPKFSWQFRFSSPHWADTKITLVDQNYWIPRTLLICSLFLVLCK